MRSPEYWEWDSSYTSNTGTRLLVLSLVLASQPVSWLSVRMPEPPMSPGPGRGLIIGPWYCGGLLSLRRGAASPLPLSLFTPN